MKKFIFIFCLSNILVSNAQVNGVIVYTSNIVAYGGSSQPPKTSNQSDGIDNNNNNQIDEPNEQFKLNLTTYFYGFSSSGPVSPAMTGPYGKWKYYNYMSGRWNDSSFFKPVGTAYNPTLNISPTNYIFTGNPQTLTGWTEATASTTPADRKMLCTIGPFNFLAKKKVEFEYAYVFSRDTTLTNVNNNFSLLQRDVKNVKYFLNQQNSPACAPTVTLGLNENRLNKSSVWIYPNPTSAELIINLNYNAKNAKIKLYDISGRILIETSIQNSYSKKLDFVNLSSGIYLVEISDENTKVTQKVIKN